MKYDEAVEFVYAKYRNSEKSKGEILIEINKK